MKLTRKHKKYIKKHIRKKSLDEIASHLQISPQEIEHYLIKIGKKQKLAKWTEGKKNIRDTNKIKQNISLFNFKTFLKENWLILAALTLLVFVSYANSLGNEFVSDDIGGIVENKNIGKLPFSFAKPISLIRFFQPTVSFLVYRVFGMSPFAFRSANITFHLGTVITLFILVYLLSGRLTAIFASAITAVHPIMTESITWISGGGYCMYGFFLVLAMLFYILIIKEKRYIYFSLASFVLALTISEKVVLFPLILAALALTYKIKPRNWKKVAALLAIPTLFVTFFFLAKLPERIEWLRTKHYQKGGLSNPLYQIPIAITSYLELIFWPKNLTLYHSEMMFSQAEYLLRLIIFIIFLTIIIYNFKRNKPISFWLSLFILGLLPSLTPFRVSWLVAERYVYFSAIGIFVVVAILVNRLNQVKTIKNIPLIIFALAIIALTARTIRRNIDWKNQDNLWLAAAKTSPSSPQNHNNLGDYYARHRDFENAIKEFKTAIKLNPNYADAYHNLANIYWQTSRADQAVENYQKALEINPKLWQSHQNLAAIFFEQKKMDLTKEHLEKAIEINPENDRLYTGLAVVYFNLGDKEKAKELLEKTIALNPQNQTAKKLLLNLQEPASD